MRFFTIELCVSANTTGIQTLKLLVEPKSIQQTQERARLLAELYEVEVNSKI